MFSQPTRSVADLRPGGVRPATTRRTTKAPAKVSTPRPAPDDFLSLTFAPVTFAGTDIDDEQFTRIAIIASFTNLNTLYGLGPVAMPHAPYPIWVTRLLEETQTRLETIEPGLKLIIAQEPGEVPAVHTVSTFEAPYNLYCLSLMPLWALVGSQRTTTKNLLLSVYAYLLHVVSIPNFLDDTTCTGYEYENWQDTRTNSDYWSGDEDDYDQERITALKRLVSRHQRRGKPLLKKLADGHHLTDFSRRVRTYRPRNEAETTLLTLAGRVLLLNQTFPTRSLCEGTYQSDYWESDFNEPELMPIDQCVFFLWDDTDAYFEDTIETFNHLAGEYAGIDSRQTVQSFATAQPQSSHDFRFETELYDLLARLDSHLYELYEPARQLTGDDQLPPTPPPISQQP